MHFFSFQCGLNFGAGLMFLTLSFISWCDAKPATMNQSGWFFGLLHIVMALVWFVIATKYKS